MPYDDLVELGWNDRPDAPEPGTAGVHLGRIGSLDRRTAAVLTGRGEQIRATVGGAEVTIGDWVVVDDEPQIVQVLGRSSLMRRMAAGDRGDTQLLAANIDLVLICQSLAATPNPRRLERELIVASDSGAEPVVVLTKADQVTPAEIDHVRAVLDEVAGTNLMVVTSVLTGQGMDEIRTLLQPNRTAVALGASGVGKSTLVNALCGTERQSTGEVRENDQRGRHTTTSRRLVLIPGGGVYLDTPGIRAVGIQADDETVQEIFADLVRLADTCRFRDCAHRDEPGCAVQAAVRAGLIDAKRVTSWAGLRAEAAGPSKWVQRKSRRR